MKYKKYQHESNYLKPAAEWISRANVSVEMDNGQVISPNNFQQVEATLREKCPNTELFLVRIFLYSD